MGPPQLSNAVRWQIIGMREACMSLRQIAFGAFIFIMSTYFKSPDIVWAKSEIHGHGR